MPEAPEEIVSHDALLAAVHVQVDAEAPTVTWPDAPAAGAVCDAGATVKVHAGGGGSGAPVCDTGIE